MIVATLLCNAAAADIAQDAIASVQGFVDRVLVIDTGDYPGEATAKFQWSNDFAAARNFALQVAADAGAEWAITLDSDERLAFRCHPQDFRAALQSQPVASWCVSDGNYSKERVIRLPTVLRWAGATHEYLTLGPRAELDCVSFTELPKSPEQYKAKLQRDLVILTDLVTEQPEDGRWAFYLGQTMEGLGHNRLAAACYMRCVGLDGWDEEAAWAAYRGAVCLSNVREYKEAIRMCALGLARHPGFPELAWYAGWCSYQLGNVRDAKNWSQIAATMGCLGYRMGEGRTSFRHLSAWYEGPYDILRHLDPEYEWLYQDTLETRHTART